MCTLDKTLLFAGPSSVSLPTYIKVPGSNTYVSFAVVANDGQRIDVPDGCLLENSEYCVVWSIHEPILVRYS